MIIIVCHFINIGIFILIWRGFERYRPGSIFSPFVSERNSRENLGRGESGVF